MPDAIDPQLDDIRRRARRRLVGAVVLALAAAVLVPMLLESDPKPLGEDVSVKIPPVDDGKFVSKLGDKARTDAPPPVKPAAPPASVAPATDATPAPAKEAAKDTVKDAASAPPAGAPKSASSATPSTAVDKPAPSTPPAKDAARDDSAKPAPAPSVATAPATPASKAPESATSTDPARAQKPAPGNFSVQLAAFSDDKGANALANRLKKSGHPAYTEPYSTSRGTLWRVRVGPYATRDAAEAARAKLKADGQNGIIASVN